jgi:hypothetical protein
MSRVRQLSLQSAGAHVEKIRDVLLRRLAVRQPLRQYLSNPPLNVVAFELRQVLLSDGIVVAGQFRIATVQRPLDGVAIEDQSRLRGAR